MDVEEIEEQLALDPRELYRREKEKRIDPNLEAKIDLAVKILQEDAEYRLSATRGIKRQIRDPKRFENNSTKGGSDGRAAKAGKAAKRRR